MAAQKSVFWVNAFTTEPYTGNPAVVIPDASDLSDEQMQRIAREMNCSETAFVERRREYLTKKRERDSSILSPW